MALDAKSLEQILLGVQIVETKVRFTARNAGTGKSLSDHLSANVTVAFGQATRGCTCSFTDKALAKQILRTVDPSLNRNAMRAKVVKEAMAKVIAAVRQAGQRAVAQADATKVPGLLQKHANREQQRALALARSRQRRDYEIAIDAIRKALTGPAKDISLEDLTHLWEECQVEVVMES